MKYKTFNFPFNLWAFILEKEGSSIEHFHFGLFHSEEDSVLDAQLRINDLVYSLLPSLPARVIEVGTGFGYMLNELNSKGYEVEGVNPDGEQVKLAKKEYAALNEVPFHSESFEGFEAKKPARALIFLESSQYIDIDQLFIQSKKNLEIGGQVIVVDEMRVAEDTNESVHAISNYDRKAEESGFEVSDVRDLTELAAPSVGFVLRCFQKYRNEILSGLDLEEEFFDQTVMAWERSDKKFKDGRRKYMSRIYTLVE